jgi:hypothetical protein
MEFFGILPCSKELTNDPILYQNNSVHTFNTLIASI